MFDEFRNVVIMLLRVFVFTLVVSIVQGTTEVSEQELYQCSKLGTNHASPMGSLKMNAWYVL
jgi:hypothetical protein